MCTNDINGMLSVVGSVKDDIMSLLSVAEVCVQMILMGMLSVVGAVTDDKLLVL